ncbi:MAG: protein kinase domain-containing protein, partial [Anaerolineae bacterium]
MDEKVLKGRYSILEVIGRGGVATVYLGWDVLARRKVAIKILKEEYTEHPEFPERFRREAEAVLHLDDPHIVGFLDYGVDEGRHFLVMEHIEGKTLAQVIQERGPLPIEEALDIACQVCDALEVAHRKGIIHRDIKPQNLMLTPDGMVKVMDFGLARVATGVTLTQTGVFMGTPRYVSPEVVKGERVDHRGDLYSLGIVLYEMLTGDIPFATDSTWALLQAHVQEIPPPVRKARPEVPEWLDRVLARALAKEPAERFQSAAEFREALQSRGMEATPPPEAVEGVAAPSRGYPWRWVPAAALGVVLLFSLGAWAAARGGWLARQAPSTPPGTEAVAVLPPTATPSATSTWQPAVGSLPTESPTPTRTFTARPIPTPTASATATLTAGPSPTPSP